jgi:hypothetical protein
MSSTTTLRNDSARTGANPNFPINTNPWRKYLSVDLGTTGIAGQNVNRSVRAGVLVVENWLFNAGPHHGETHTLVLVATTTNEIYCYGEGSLLANGTAAVPLWQTALGVQPIMRGGSNIAPPLGVCGTPVVDTDNRRMFVAAMWDDGSGTGNYSMFNLALDTGTISASQKLVDAGAPGRAKFNGNVLDQRTAINLVAGWLWLGFADFQFDDLGRYYGWVVAISPDDLTKQLYQPMVSLTSSNTWGIFAGGVWGPGGVAAAVDGSVYALTGNATQLAASDATGNHPQDNLTSFGKNYWGDIPAAGPGSIGDYFNALVRVGVEVSGSTPKLTVLDWFQGSAFTQSENTADFDFGGSSPVVLPPINGQQLVAFVPKDGDVFLLDSQNLGHYSTPLTRVKFADAFNSGGNDTKVAIAFLQTPDGRNVLIVGADSNGSLGGFAAFQVDATTSPPTLTKLWQSASQLRDSFGSPIVIANPARNAPTLPNPVGLAWVIDGDDAGDNFLKHCVMRAYDILTGTVAYDSTAHNDVSEEIPHFAPITSGGNSVFCTTSKGFMGFTQFVPVTKSLTFILDRSTFGKDEVDAKEPTPTSVASFGSAYWIAVNGVLPSELGLTPGNLSTPPQKPTVTPSFDSTLPGNVATAIKNMLNAGQFTGPVIPENPALPDEPQGFLFPYAVSFTGDQGFQAMNGANPSIGSTLVTLQASLTVAGTPPLSNSAQIELVTGADPFFVDVNPSDPTQPTWLSFDVRLFKVTGNTLKFGAFMSTDPADAPGFIAQVITNLNANHGVVGTDSFEGQKQDEESSALEFNPTNSDNLPVFNFALARVRLLGKTTGPTPYPVRVFFRLFQAQNTVSDFSTNTTYRFATDGTPHGRKIPLLGVQNDAHGNPEYVTIPCFATSRVNLKGPVDMNTQGDSPNAYAITITTPGVEVDSYFGCWVDINQPHQKFLPSTPPVGNLDGPWTTQWAGNNVHSIQDSLISAPHQCLIAEIRYDDAPVVPNATSATSDKLAQRNIAWIDGPNPGLVESRRMTHPVQIRPTPTGTLHPDELMIFWGNTPAAGQAQLYLPALSAAEIAGLANRLYPAQQMDIVDEHTVGFATNGATFVPLPTGTALAAGLLTVNLPPGIRKGDQYQITVRQLTDASLTIKQPPPPPPPPQLVEARAGRGDRAKLAPSIIAKAAAGAGVDVEVQRTWRRVAGAFQVVINIKTKGAILLNEERLLATLRWMELQMPTTKRWFPVLQRYIDYVAGRVLGFGGNPGQILPSPTGWVPGLPEPSPQPSPHHHHECDEFTGKIEGLIYDHFGDFEGFVVETETGIHHKVFSREQAVRELAEHARVERSRVKVIVERHHRHLRQLEVV